MRELLNHPCKNEFTQGSIFEGLKIAGNYAVKGMVITARCDISNEKSRNILCLPVYPLSEWILSHGDEIIFRRVNKKLRAKITFELAKYDSLMEIVDTYPADNFIKSLMAVNENVPDDLVSMIYMYKNEKCDFSLDFVKAARKELVKSVLRNTEPSIYYIEQVYLNEVLDSHVIDLTDPFSIPNNIAKSLCSGMTDRRSPPDADRYFILSSNAICYISVLTSPYIEHVLQKFSYYYSRIGTDDICEDSMKILEEILDEA